MKPFTIKIHALIVFLLNTFVIICSLFLIEQTNMSVKDAYIFVTILMWIQFGFSILQCVALNSIKNTISFLFFIIAYFILLIGSYSVHIGDMTFYGQFTFMTRVQISHSIELQSMHCIVLSLYLITFFYTLGSCFFKPNFNVLSKNDSELFRKISLSFMFLGGIAAFLKSGSTMLYGLQYGYTSLYLASGTTLFQNPFIDLFDKFYILGLYGYLATFPAIDKLKIPLITFFVYLLISLFTGYRGTFVIGIVFLIWYFAKRDLIFFDRKQFYTKRKMILLSVCCILLPILMQIIGSLRVGGNVDLSQIDELFFGFFDSQGLTGKLGAVALQYREAILSIAEPFELVIAPLKNFLINNSLVRLFTGGILGQSFDSLTTNPNFGAVATYVTNTAAYFSGGAIGTCYFVEAMIGYGFIGLLCANLIVALLLCWLDNITANTWYLNILKFNLVETSIYTPRHSLFDFVPNSFSAVIFILITYFIVVLARERYVNR